MTAALENYDDFAGRRLAVVESMLHHPYYLGLRQARERGLHVTLLISDREWYTHGGDWETHPLAEADCVLELNTSDVDAVVDAVTSDDGFPLVDGIASYSDYHTEVAAEAARRLGLPGPDPASLRRANQKHLLRLALGDVPYNIPHVLAGSAADLDDAVEKLGFPMIAKPPAEAISYGVRRVDDEEQLHEAFAELSTIRSSLRGQPRTGEVLLEEYVEGVEVSVESMTVDGVTHIFGVTSKDLFGDPAYIECGHTFPVPLTAESRAELYAAVRGTLEAIGYDRGPCHTEVRDTPDGWRVIEANPRTPSSCMTMLVTDVTGHSPILDGWLLALGLTPNLDDIHQQGGAAVRMIYPSRRGILRRIDGLEEAASVPGVELLLHVHEGQMMLERMDNSACVGFTYCAGDDRELAQKAADRAAAQLDFVVEEVRA